MSTPLVLTHPLGPIRPIQSARASALIIILMVVARWGAGMVEHWGLVGFSEYVSLGMLAGLALLFLVHLRLARHSTLLLAGLLTLLFAAQVSYAANPMPHPAEAHALMALICLYALAAHGFFLHLRTIHALKALRWFFLVFLGVGGALVLAQISTGFGFVDPARAHLIRAVGSDVHPVSYALQLVLAGVGLAVVLVKLRHPIGIVTVVAFGLGAIALYLTFARTAWVMVAMIAFFVMWAQGGVMAKVLGCLALAGVALGLSQSDRFSDLGSLPFFLANFDWHNIVFDHRYVDNSVSWRIVNWGYGLTQAMESPWLGLGPAQSVLASSFGKEMHNIVLEVFLEMGAVGLVGLALIFVGLLRLHRGLPRDTKPARLARALINAAGLSLAAAALFSTGLVDQLMSILIYFMILAAGYAPNREREAPLS